MSMHFENYQGANVPVCTDLRGGVRVSLWSRRATNEVMFSDGHGGATARPREGQGWVPVTVTLPQNVAPRQGVEDGVVATLAQMMRVYYGNARVLC